MPLDLHITVYAATIAAMLTFMRIILGVTGSWFVRINILRTVTTCAFFLFVTGITKVFMYFPWFSQLVSDNRAFASTTSTSIFLIWSLCMTYFFGLGVLIRLYVRSLRFKDWGTFKNLRALPPATWIRKSMRKKKGDYKDYETDPIHNEQKSHNVSLKNSLGIDHDFSTPVLLSGKDIWTIRKSLIKYCIDLSTNSDEEINYICCNVSPSNIWTLVKELSASCDINKLKKSLVFVDAYTTTFGFDDEILNERIRQMRVKDQVDIVDCQSAAGIHSGTAIAFKLLKAKATQNKYQRRPCTVIYDSLSVMSIPETEEEVAEFVVHLTAAELTYDMKTILLEADAENRNNLVLDAMRACCGTAIEVPNNDNI